MLMGHQDYRVFLKSVLEERACVNRSYSLRAFARDLAISPQMLSFVLNKKKGLSSEVAANIAGRLDLDPAESSYFVDLVTLAHARSAQARILAQHRIDERRAGQDSYRNLTLDIFKTISDWRHCAVLELTCLTDFSDDPKWLARKLGVTMAEATQTFARLRDLGLIETGSDGRYKKTDVNLTASYGAPSSALRKLARQYLQRAIDALESQTLEERDITNITMAIDPALLPEAKRMITAFRRKLCAFLEQGQQTEIYTFAPSLFRLTPSAKKNQPKKRSL